MLKYKFIERDDLPYFRDVRRYEYKGKKKSSFFVFSRDVDLLVLKTKWSLLKYLKSLLKFKFKIDNGYEHSFEKQLFSGLYADEEVQYRIKKTLISKEYRPNTRAYIKVEAKGEGYDFVLGEVSEDGKSIKNVYRCKKLHSKQYIPKIIRGMEIDVNCQIIPIGSLESFSEI